MFVRYIQKDKEISFLSINRVGKRLLGFIIRYFYVESTAFAKTG